MGSDVSTMGGVSLLLFCKLMSSFWTRLHAGGWKESKDWTGEKVVIPLVAWGVKYAREECARRLGLSLEEYDGEDHSKMQLRGIVINREKVRPVDYSLASLSPVKSNGSVSHLRSLGQQAYV